MKWVGLFGAWGGAITSRVFEAFLEFGGAPPHSGGEQITDFAPNGGEFAPNGVDFAPNGVEFLEMGGEHFQNFPK